MLRENRTNGRCPHRAGLLTVDTTEPSAHGWPAGQSADPFPPVDV